MKKNQITLKNKTFRQQDQEQMKGKKAFRLREINEMEDLQQMKEYFLSHNSCKEYNDTSEKV